MKKMFKKSVLLMIVFTFVLSLPVFAAAEVHAQDRGTKTFNLLNQMLERVEAQYYDGVTIVDEPDTTTLMVTTVDTTYDGNTNGLLKQLDAVVHIFRANLQYFDIASDEVQDFITRLETMRGELQGL